jgi:hypothetical protein
VNLYLHGFTDPHLYEYDTLTSEERWNDFALTPRRSRHNCHCRTGSPVALLLRALSALDPFQMLVVGDRGATDIVDDLLQLASASIHRSASSGVSDARRNFVPRTGGRERR